MVRRTTTTDKLVSGGIPLETLQWFLPQQPCGPFVGNLMFSWNGTILAQTVAKVPLFFMKSILHLHRAERQQKHLKGLLGRKHTQLAHLDSSCNADDRAVPTSAHCASHNARACVKRCKPCAFPKRGMLVSAADIGLSARPPSTSGCFLRYAAR